MLAVPDTVLFVAEFVVSVVWMRGGGGERWRKIVILLFTLGLFFVLVVRDTLKLLFA